MESKKQPQPTQLQLFSQPIQLVVRSGKGRLLYNHQHSYYGEDSDFTDRVEIVDRIPRDHTGWQSIRYKSKRYQLFGGIRTPHFICLNSPIE